MDRSAFDSDPRGLLFAGPGFRLADVDPRSTPGFPHGKKAGKAALVMGAKALSHAQEQLFAESRHGGSRSVLLILQAMDTAGKGGVVRHVIGAVDPQGVHHHAFKAPTAAERRHDFLWRIQKQLPGPGLIGVFDRSHYEDVLVHKVGGLSSAEEVERRYGAIAQFETGLAAADTRVLKVMLHISKKEQKRRLAERLDRPDKYWKYSTGDVDERAHWDGYQEAYQAAITRSSTDEAPWYVVPADRKWYARLAVQHLLASTLADLKLGWPEAHFDVEAEKVRLAAS